MKQGDGPGVIQNCRRLAWSWSAMVLGLNGSDLAGRLENNPQASFFDEFWLQGLRAAPAALVGALVCLIFWKNIIVHVIFIRMGKGIWNDAILTILQSMVYQIMY